MGFCTCLASVKSKYSMTWYQASRDPKYPKFGHDVTEIEVIFFLTNQQGLIWDAAQSETKRAKP